MKVKIFMVMLVLVTLLAGCRGQTVNTVSVNQNAVKEITSVNDFQNTYRDWASRLASVSGSTDQAYSSWLAGQISRDEFAARTRDLYKETKRLKTESSYNIVFNLSESDRKLAYYDLITDSYSKALLQMNDFLDLLPTLNDEQIRTSYKYTGKVVNDEMSKVKRHLDK